MNKEDFTFLSTLLRKRSGLALKEEKMYLLETRLLPIARSHGMQDISELARRLKSGGDEALVTETVEAMTTHESSFFRDTKPFDQFRSVVLPRLMEACKESRKIRIWSAACSTGQEPYSIAMCLMEESAKMQGWSYEILATDISGKVLEKAKKAEFSQFEIQRGLPIQMLIKYFTQGAHETWKAKPEVINKVNFKQVNLLENIAALGRFDVIFCRNVLIYFDEENKRNVLEKFTQNMHPHSLLFLGSTETIIGVTSKFTPLENERGIYTLAP